MIYLLDSRNWLWYTYHAHSVSRESIFRSEAAMQAKSFPKPIYIFLFSALLILLFGCLATAQVDTGSILGTVRDESGAVVPGARVTLLDQGTGLVLSASTNASGIYDFTPIKIGTYKVTASKTGFKNVSQSNIVVNVQAQMKVDLTLTPGMVTQTVEVTGVTPLLQTQNVSTGQVVTARQVNDLPLNGRNYTFLAQLAPGVTTVATGGGGRFNGTGGFVSNGLGAELNNYILDGIDNNNDSVDFLNGTAYVDLTPPDAVQEFKVQTSNFDAEFGRAGGAVINATTKSGTNQLHGDAWEYLENDALDANSWTSNRVGQQKGYYNQNMFGFTLGGPVVIPHIYNGHNKTFFFGDFQGIRIRNDALHNPTVPSAPEVASNYTDYQDLFGVSSTTTVTDFLGRSFNSNTIFDPATTRPVTKGQVDPVTGLVAIGTGYTRDPFYLGTLGNQTDFTTAAQEKLMNIIPANRIDRNAIKILQLLPAQNLPIALSGPGSNGTSNNYGVLRSQPDGTNHFDVRMDEDFSPKDQLFGRVSYNKRNAFFPGDFVGLASNAGFGAGNFTDFALNTMLSETHIISPTLVNEFRAGYSRLHTVSNPTLTTQSGIPAQFGIQGISQANNNYGLPYLNISGLTGIGAGNWASPNVRFSNTWQVEDNLTKISGKHTFKGGFQAQFLRFPWLNTTASRGNFAFGTYAGTPDACNAGTGVNGVACKSTSTGGPGIADFLLTPIASTVPGGIDFVGGPNSVSAANAYWIDDVRHYYGAYFQDTYKALPKLTLDLGLRWEFFGQVDERYGSDAILDPGTYSAVNDQLPPQETVSNARYIINCAEKNLALSPSFTSLLTKDHIALDYSCTPGLINTPLTDFSPRAGLAWQVRNNLVVRLGYGIFFGGFQSIGGAPDPGFNYPGVVSLSSPNHDDAHPIVYSDGQNATLERGLLDMEPVPNSPGFSAEGLGLTAFSPSWKTQYTQEWNFTIQYEPTRNQTVTLAYVANTSRHMLNGEKRNQPDVLLQKPLPKGYNAADYNPWPDFANNSDFITDDGDAYYYSFQGTYERRFSHGMQALVDYTYSRCMTDARNILNSFGDNYFDRLGGGVLPGYSIKNDYRFCGSDVPNLLHASGIWQLPFGRNQRFGRNLSSVANAIIGGWQAQGIWTVESGFPLNIGCATVTISNSASWTCTPDLVPGQKLYLHQGPNGGIDEFLNPAAFTDPVSCTPPAGSTDGIGCTAGFAVPGGRPYQGHGPTYDNGLDFSMFKEFRTSERTHLEFRAEFFNLTNHTSFGLPGNNNYLSAEQNQAAGKPFTFSNITGTASLYMPRTIQFALKFYW